MTSWLPVLLIIFVVFLLISLYKKLFSTKKKLNEITTRWGKPIDSQRNFKSISGYLDSCSDENYISQETASDLNMEEVFSFIDRTSSKPGQQYLYKKIYRLETDEIYFAKLEERIDKLNKNQQLREQIELKLSELNHNDAYYLPKLFSKEHKSLFKPLTESYIKISAIIIITLIILLIAVPNQIYLFLLLVMFITNMVIHFRNKRNILSYTHSLPQLLTLIKVGKWLAEKECLEQNDIIKKSLAKVSKLKRSLSMINLQSKANSDPTDFSYLFTEWLNMLLLIEPLVFVSSIKKVNKYLSDIRMIYESIAEIDMAISIQSVRDGLPYYCTPNLVATEEKMTVKDLFHPLVDNCVANSISSDNSQGVLITGSNMSGKTTFIRAIAVNALLSQTIHTSCTTTYQGPPIKIFTSINMSDNLGEHKSYFQAEALSVLNILNHCSSNEPVKSLVIIDEIFRGTNTIERIAAAKAVLSYLIENKNFVFVSTHDVELAALLGNDYAVYSFEELIGDNRLIFDYKIKEGLLKNKNGIAVLQGLGYPQIIIDDAYIVSKQLRDKYDL